MNISPDEGIATANLADELIALSRRLATPLDAPHATFYFDYQGSSQFGSADVAGIVTRAEPLLAEGLGTAAHGKGSVFLTVHAWPFHSSQCRVLVQVAFTAVSGRRDFQQLSSVSTRWGDQAGGTAQRPAWEAGPPLAKEGDAPCHRWDSPGEGCLLEFVVNVSLPALGETPASVKLATLSAWLIGSPAQTDAVLASRLQRDGWLVRLFADLDAALEFKLAHEDVGMPGLVVVAEAEDEGLASLGAARAVFTPDCRVVLGIQPASALAGRVKQIVDGVEVRTLPFSPLDLRDFKEVAARCEAMRYGDSVPSALDGAGRPRVLVVDDGPINQALAQAMLKVLGYASDVAVDGRQAIEYIKRYRPSAILMDLDMPVMGGIEATERIRRFEAHEQAMRPPIPIIATTSREDEDTARLCLSVGMNAFVPKPMMLTSLATALSACGAMYAP